MVSLQFDGLDSEGDSHRDTPQTQLMQTLSEHPWWSEMKGWKQRLNNLQLIIQPYVYFCLIKPWLKVFEIPPLKIGFSRLIAIMNEFKGWLPTKTQLANLFFSSA